MAGCERCALKGEKREREKEEKRKGKERKKWGSKSFFFCFFYKSVRMFFSYAQWSFIKYIRKTVSRLRRSYPPLFAVKILMESQFGDLLEPNMHPYPYFGNFFKYLWTS